VGTSFYCNNRNGWEPSSMASFPGLDFPRCPFALRVALQNPAQAGRVRISWGPGGLKGETLRRFREAGPHRFRGSRERGAGATICFGGRVPCSAGFFFRVSPIRSGAGRGGRENRAGRFSAISEQRGRRGTKLCLPQRVGTIHSPHHVHKIGARGRP